jgi:rhodanese-related sulfurtransferase
MKKLILFIILFTTTISCITQKTIPEVIKRFNKNSVTYISVAELKDKKEVILFDAREKSEYDVSHIENAIYVGYSDFDSKTIVQQYPDKNSEIIVYCSLGIRSENIGEKLGKLGYTNVKNLYGGIFEWKNEQNPLIDNEGKITNEVHAFSKMWGKYLIKGIKIYKK